MGEGGRAVVGGCMVTQPGLEPVQVRDRLARARFQLAGPAVDLPLEVVPGTPEIAKADVFGAHRMHRRHGVGDSHPEGRALCGIGLGQGAIREDAALDPLHQVERRADHVGIVAVENRRGDRHVCRMQRLDNAVFAVDRVRALEDRAVRLLAQHHPAAAPPHEVGGVGLPARDAVDREVVRRSKSLGEEVARPIGVEVGARGCRLSIAHAVLRGLRPRPPMSRRLGLPLRGSAPVPSCGPRRLRRRAAPAGHSDRSTRAACPWSIRARH